MSASGQAYDNKGIDQTILKLEIIAGKGKTSLTSNCEFIFVLDKSGSMGSYVKQILNNVFPRVYDKLGFSESKNIHFITFDSSTNYYSYNKNDFKNSDINGGGGTSMSSVPGKLSNILKNIDSNKTICLLTLSDGMIGDQDETQKEATKLINEINGRFTNLKSQAIRFMSSNYAQPDTRALCSLLQLNSNIQSNNSDILLTFNPINSPMSNEKIEELANEIAKLFEGAEGSGWILTQKGNKKFKIEPYGEEYSFLELPKGKTNIFIDGICGNDILSQFDLSTQGETASISSKGEVTQKNLYEVYEDEIMKCMKKILINKGSGNSLSKKNNEKIINFIQILEDKTPGNKILNNSNNLTKIFKEINDDPNSNNLSGNKLNDYMKKKQDECKQIINKIVEEEINNRKQENLNELIILIDASEKMENYIQKVNQILYEAIIKLDPDENKKIKIYPFNGESPGSLSVKVKKLKKQQIDCESERDIFDSLQEIIEFIFRNTEKKFKLLTITSGEIESINEIRALIYKAGSIKKFASIKSEIVLLKTKDSDFKKNEKGEFEYDYVTYSLIKQIGIEEMDNYKPEEINYDDDIKTSAEKIYNLIK